MPHQIDQIHPIIRPAVKNYTIPMRTPTQLISPFPNWFNNVPSPGMNIFKISKITAHNDGLGVIVANH